MEVRTYRATTLQGALQLVQEELGSDAAVLETKRIWDSPFGRMFGWNQVEVVASVDVHIPSRFARRAKARDLDVGLALDDLAADSNSPSGTLDEPDRLSLDEKVANLREATPRVEPLSAADFQLCADLIEAEVEPQLARELVRIASEQDSIEAQAGETSACRQLVRDQIADDISIQGDIQVSEAPNQSARIVALVGPTGVGKTTTIAKLAANFQLRDKRRVGLITVDTYRIAAVEQLKTYADIIDLPMEVVASNRELRSAMERLSHLDLILMDTAGRSPQNEADLNELKLIMEQAQPHQVHLVLSATASSQSLIRTAERFSRVGTTSLILTKLDESLGLGNLIPVWREVPLPLSYVTNGQNVPDDIRTANAFWLAEQILPHEPELTPCETVQA